MSEINFQCDLKDLYAIKHSLETGIKNKEERIILSRAAPEIAIECAKHIGGTEKLVFDPEKLRKDIEHEKKIVDNIVRIINNYSTTSEHYSHTAENEEIICRKSINDDYTSLLTVALSDFLGMSCTLTHKDHVINTLWIYGVCQNISSHPFTIGYITYDTNCIITDIVIHPIRCISYSSYRRTDIDISELNKFIGKKLTLTE